MSAYPTQTDQFQAISSSGEVPAIEESLIQQKVGQLRGKRRSYIPTPTQAKKALAITLIVLSLLVVLGSLVLIGLGGIGGIGSELRFVGTVFGLPLGISGLGVGLILFYKLSEKKYLTKIPRNRVLMVRFVVS